MCNYSLKSLRDNILEAGLAVNNEPQSNLFPSWPLEEDGETHLSSWNPQVRNNSWDFTAQLTFLRFFFFVFVAKELAFCILTPCICIEKM